jgi:HEAT repeat protein
LDVAEALAILAGGEGGARAAALRWLGEHAPGGLTREHAALLADADLEVRTAATVVLRASADLELVQAARLALRELVMSPEVTVRHAGLRAAAGIANPTLAPRLLPFLDDPDPESRRLALLALAAVPQGLLAPDFLRGHAQAALADPDAGVRDAAQALIAGATEG